MAAEIRFYLDENIPSWSKEVEPRNLVSELFTQGSVGGGSYLPPLPCTQTAAEPFVNLYTDEDRATRLGCPINPGFTTLTPSQQFEEGFMLKIEDTIYVFWLDNSVVPYPDTWDKSQTIDNPTLTPSDNLQQPTRRFGKIWYDRLGGSEAKIGWALEAEQEYEITYQHFSGGLMFIAPDGEVYTLFEE